MSAPFGLDFGNDTSVFAVARNRNIDVIVNDVSNRSTPSVVGFGQKNRFIGETGKSKESSNIKNTVGNLKRIIGLNYDDVDFEIEKKFFNKTKFVKLEDGKIGVQCRFKNENVTFSAVQLAAMYLDHSKQIIETQSESSTKSPLPVFLTVSSSKIYQPMIRTLKPETLSLLTLVTPLTLLLLLLSRPVK